ncbi:HAD family hydrolase [Streptosporangium sp. NPDC002607]
MADVIFFDLDGTLVDHRSAAWEAIGQIVQVAPNATAPPEELVTLWWTLEGRHMREYLAGQCSFAEHHRRRLRSFLPMLGEPVPESPGLLDAWIADRYLTVFEESWRSYPDVQPCLETLKRLPRGPRLREVSGPRHFLQPEGNLCAARPVIFHPFTRSEEELYSADLL